VTASVPAGGGFNRQGQLALFGGYDLPVLNVTAECRSRDFVAPAKALGLPPFALLLYALAKASLEVENFRYRLQDGDVQVVTRLTASYTLLDRNENLNFSNVPFDADWRVFLERYLAEREVARHSSLLEAAPLPNRDFIFVTCLPWLRFTSIQHPIARLGDTSIPSFAAGRFERSAGEVTFPLSVQAHHGLVDGLHIHRLMACVEGELAQLTGALGAQAGSLPGPGLTPGSGT